MSRIASMKAKPVPRVVPTQGPQFVGYFWPVIEALKQLGGSARPAEVRERVVTNLTVSEALQTEVTSNGRALFDNRVAWARFYLAKAGLIDSSLRGVWSLTEKGRSMEALSPAAAVDLFRAVASQFRDGMADQLAEVEAESEREAPPEPTASSANGDHRLKVLELLRGGRRGGCRGAC